MVEEISTIEEKQNGPRYDSRKDSLTHPLKAPTYENVNNLGGENLPGNTTEGVPISKQQPRGSVFPGSAARMHRGHYSYGKG